MPAEFGGRGVILDTAAKLFSQQGYKGVSIRDIAQACGLTNAALYYYFKNKEELYLAVMEYAHARAMTSVTAGLDDRGDLRARLKQLVTRYVESMQDQRESFVMLRRDLDHVADIARAGKLLGGMHRDFMQPLQTLIETGQTDGQLLPGDAALYALFLHGMIIALTYRRKHGHRLHIPPEEIDALVEVFLNGLSCREQASELKPNLEEYS
jgi:AcrR family transcriptional regulator